MSAQSTSERQETIVVIGNGMVGLRFCEKIVEYDTEKRYRVVTFCEEPRAAYDRVGLTSFFAHRDAEKLLLARIEWYEDHGVELHLGTRAALIDRKARCVISDKGQKIEYDHIVLATGSYPFVPPVPGIDKVGVYLYRTIEDLERIIDHGARAKSAAVIGGGLLGLEAAKAAYDLGVDTHVIEFAPRLMPRQIDEAGSRILVKQIEDLGVRVHLNKQTKEVLGNGHVEGMMFTDGEELDVDMIIVSAGIRPRDELARECQLDVGERGGVVVNDLLQTSDPDIYAVGEVALHGGLIYGLVAPGYEMAEVVARNFTGGDHRFQGTDVSTKLKLMGIDVASFGDYEGPFDDATPIAFEDPLGGTYKKLIFTNDGKHLLGGVLVGDASDYSVLAAMSKSDQPLACAPHELIVGAKSGENAGGDGLPDDAQICSCNNVSKGQLISAICDNPEMALDGIKKCTQAGTGCGGCMPLVTSIFRAEKERSGQTIVNHLCEHFAYSRTELFAIIKTKQLKTFNEVLAEYGSGSGCELCKPAVASILASLWNQNLVDKEVHTLQDTNDRFLANIQRGGSFSVVPRVAGGEITPDKLIVLGQVAIKYNLYTKITGGQRVDLFGAQVQDLPDIWEELVNAGFESGHAYGKALRTVKSCVGSTWCRYGVQDSVGTAIRIENRYKGIRAPHKIKMAVSGCTRECAEAQSKDVGLIATEKGYNLYVCGNGGTKPRHTDLLATDLTEEEAIRLIDRFLGYYISTADKLTRTSVWLDSLEGGIEHLKAVLVNDSLGLCADFEEMIQYLVDTYECEWAAVVRDPNRRKWFRQFSNTVETEPNIEFVSQRGQQRPADWPTELVSLQQFQQEKIRVETVTHDHSQEGLREWIEVGRVDDFPVDGGATIKYGDTQIAVYNFATRGEWYACQNMCPHRKAFVLSQGIIGDVKGVPKVACPLHKKSFSLETGESLQEEEYQIETFPVRIEEGTVYLELPPKSALDRRLGTKIGCRLATVCDNPSERELVADLH